MSPLAGAPTPRLGAPSIERPHLAWWLAILGGLAATAALALSDAAYAWFAEHVTRGIPRPAIAAIFGWACWLHVRKGLRAVQLAERAGLHETSLAWGWQTFWLGFASLRLLERRIARTARAVETQPEVPRA